MKTATKTIAAVTAVVAGAFVVQAAIAGPGGHPGFGGPGMMGHGGPGMMMQGPGQGYGPGQGFGPGMGHQGMMGHMMGSPMRTQTTFDPAWAETAKTDLGITAEQTPAWTAYVDAVKNQIETHQTLRDSMDPKTMHELSWDDHRGVMQSHWETQQELTEAVTTAKTELLAQLTPKQQSKANYLLGQQAYANHGPMGRGMYR